MYKSLFTEQYKPQSYETSAYLGKTSLFDVLNYKDAVDVLFIGDSHTDRADFYTMFNGMQVVSQGIGGDTSKGLLNRINKTKGFNPKVIVIEIGVNDLIQGAPVEEVVENYQLLIDGMKTIHPSSTIVIETIYPVTRSFEENDAFKVTCTNIRKVNAALKNIADERGLELIDTYTMLEDENGYLKEEYTCDGLHLTGNAYMKLQGEIQKILN